MSLVTFNVGHTSDPLSLSVLGKRELFIGKEAHQNNLQCNHMQNVDGDKMANGREGTQTDKSR